MIFDIPFFVKPKFTHWTLFEWKYDKIVDNARRFYPVDVAKATLMT
jgi:hypothetical protein